MFELTPKRNYKRMKWIVTFKISDNYPIESERGKTKTHEWVTNTHYTEKGERKPFNEEKARKEWNKTNKSCEIQNIKGFPTTVRL